MERFLSIFKYKDLQKKIIYSLVMLLFYRLGSHIPISGIDLSDLNNLNYLIIDCLKIKKHPSHFNLKDALSLIEKIKPKKSILTN